MTTPNHTYAANLRPELLASMIRHKTGEDISICPDTKDKHVNLGAVSRLGKPSKRYGYRLFTRGKSPERKALEQEKTGKKSVNKLLIEVLDEGLSNAKMAIVEEERLHCLGISELHADLYQFPEFVSPKQARIMAYYLPWKTQIREDLDLMGRCFESVLGFPVTVTRRQPLDEEIGGMQVGNWITDFNDIAGGKRPKRSTCVLISVGPVPPNALHQFIPGTENARFWEELLFKTFLPEKWDFELEVLAGKKEAPEEKEENNVKFFTPHDNALALTGINSYIQ